MRFGEVLDDKYVRAISNDGRNVITGTVITSGSAGGHGIVDWYVLDTPDTGLVTVWINDYEVEDIER